MNEVVTPVLPYHSGIERTFVKNEQKCTMPTRKFMVHSECGMRPCAAALLGVGHYKAQTRAALTAEALQSAVSCVLSPIPTYLHLKSTGFRLQS
jgi:hypothetical protein